MRPIVPPPVALQLLRTERLAEWADRRAARVRALSPPKQAAHRPTRAAAPDEAVPSSRRSKPDADVRYIRVRARPRTTTFEDLARRRLHSAEQKRPRELYEARLLLRQGGPVRTCDASRRIVAFAAARATLRSHRAALKECIAGEERRRWGLPEETPVAVMVELLELIGTGPIPARRWAVRFEPTSERWSVVDPSGILDAPARTCIASVLNHGPQPAPSTPAFELPLTAFSQPRWSVPDPGSIYNDLLARQAVLRGLQHYARGEFSQALGYFQDAAWIFRLAEYNVLVGLTFERLGRGTAAAAAYGRYLERRPEGIQAEQLRERIRRLTLPLGAGPGDGAGAERIE